VARAAHPVRHDVSLLTDEDLHLFNEGTHRRLYRRLGAHVLHGPVEGTSFAVWAPNAESVHVIGDFNGWDRGASPLRPRGSSGIWEGVVEGVGHGAVYKYHVASREAGYRVDKADPFAFHAETPPRTASVVWDVEGFAWTDERWLADRAARRLLSSPMSVYELHVGSWMRVPEEGGRSLTYRELAPRLTEHVRRLGFTHVELMPIMEHPYAPSWGYQSTGYFAPTSRFGTPQDLMGLVDHLHRHGIGVLLDWVPSHFPTDEHGLGYFDGTHLYEHADPRLGFHQDWTSFIFNYGRNEVRSFLLSSASYWLDVFHADGLRVDAVASMLYLDYSREEGQWIPNQYGGNENLEAVRLLRELNTAVYADFPGAEVVAEESTAWPGVSRPADGGGLGFGFKWDMGWMHDTLAYLALEPIHRRYHQGQITFRALYAFSENYVLPLSHDEVVHGKGSLLARMPGDAWQQFANLRLLYGYMWAQPGKKLLFMGGEFGQGAEWKDESSLDWHLLDVPYHAGVQRWVGDLNAVMAAHGALHERDCVPEGFEWVDASDEAASVISFLRRGHAADEVVLAAFNFTPVARSGYRLGVPLPGRWSEIACSDAADYGGSGVGNAGGVEAGARPAHGRPWSLDLTLPPLGCVYLKAPQSG
jgi:1,4-alpha-glucan branching enzyme